MTDFLQRFAEGFASLDKHNLERVETLYSADIAFRDPLHEVHGLKELRAYYAQLYANLSALRFVFDAFDELREGEGYLRWTMHYRHPRLAGGKPLQLEGCSHLLWRDGKVYRHRDYFDAGALLYEHIPVLGGAIRLLKRRLA
ncbi:nuclear transport factor 2 family protein [Pseudomonas sp. LRF_L74]|uniref:nuclear transport factor 2 family protein n=1 Tax=Pseudomonas sp. LRF_L74 TaxID=3369422 RepID=UPI003F5EDC00